MEKLNRKGEIGRLGEGHFEWRICNFHIKSSRNTNVYVSPDFSCLNRVWHLKMRPTPTRDFNLRNRLMDLFLVKRDVDPSTTVKVTLSFKKMDGTKEIYEEKRHSFPTKIDAVMCLRKIPLYRPELAPYSGSLIVTFTIIEDEHYILQDSLLERLMNLNRSMNDILSQRENTDIVLKLKTREIPAHRLILKSRSTFFKNMLDSDMCESRSGVIELVDDDEDAFDIVLSYIYCGCVEKLDYKNVCEVYKIADKYDLQELKKLCSVFITKNMCVYFVCDVFAMSKLYEEAELNKRAKDYFAKNGTEIIKTEKWIVLKRDNPELAIELLEWSYTHRMSPESERDIRKLGPSTPDISPCSSLGEWSSDSFPSSEDFIM